MRCAADLSATRRAGRATRRYGVPAPRRPGGTRRVRRDAACARPARIIESAMDALWLGCRLLLLLAVANASPIVAAWLLHSRWRAPLDGGLSCPDGRRLLGDSKTIRGVVVAIVATALAAPLLGIAPGLGAIIGAVAMAGDATSSFVKRRLAIASSDRATGLDQIPESLLPLLAVRGALELSFLQIGVVTVLFLLLEIPAARVLHRLGIRERPY
jgi:CDP-2,3-bis-(O-geranylgeranyl)-sn-glycerol synthase